MVLAQFRQQDGHRYVSCRWRITGITQLSAFVSRLSLRRRALGAAADQRLLVDTRAAGHLLGAAQGLNRFVSAARAAAAEVLVLDPLYSTHDQDENDTRAMAALCQSLCQVHGVGRPASNEVRSQSGGESSG